MLAPGLVAFECRAIGGRNRGLRTDEAGGRTARDALVANERGDPASYSPGGIVGTGPIGFSGLRIIAKHPDRIISA